MKGPQSEANEANEIADVIVIGAGLAGLAAALKLAESRKKVTLLEARNRVGGRILTELPAGWPKPAELGAEFIHGDNPAFAAALRRAKITREPMPNRHWLIHHGRRVAMPDAWERINKVMAQIGSKFRGSFADWLRSNGQGLADDDRDLAINFVKGFQGAPPDRMSAPILFAATKEDDEQARPRNGYGQLVETLFSAVQASRVNVFLNTVVNRLMWERGAVTVRSADSREWRARTALVTLPLGVLTARGGDRSARLRFMPTLKEKTQYWRKLRSGHALRLILRMRADVWRRGIIPPELRTENGRAFGFLHSTEEFFPVWWTAAPAPILVGWTGGPSAERMGSWTNRQLYVSGISTLAKLLACRRSQLEGAIVDWRTHNWAADPYARGAYSFATAGMEEAPRILARPVARTIFFAGEATADPLELGTVHGALASAERAAKEILATLKKR